ncbi:hypothetical protein GUITHDRAFT_109000 [Guillardia theta CCMP2712]|uniref:PDZ domain-containing protein n=1 Tax=Guillardia theta (strain CCMP2712) TaxID=905079 RepID=L1J8V9_GUITC|nr:hypothetical protein GUITHDRAFT_109000 [Guillardia theta CCMP2712]EKX44956.1 hypothetical protein GUITHDRAFT_109000 [Guillardia theta CCMP2712]|eukprot:XP_005831936.1 hypothetical protein GUITHDRAFT_109000 [Guillardia theta CCMP2712]
MSIGRASLSGMQGTGGSAVLQDELAMVGIVLEGSKIMRVVAGSPAHLACRDDVRIEAGDAVIAVDGMPVDDRTAPRALSQNKFPGTMVEVTIEKRSRINSGSTYDFLGMERKRNQERVKFDLTRQSADSLELQRKMSELADHCLGERQDQVDLHRQLKELSELLVAHNVAKEAWVTNHILSKDEALKFPDHYLGANAEKSREMLRTTDEIKHLKKELESVRASERKTKAELIEAKLVLKHSESETMQLLQQSNVELEQCYKKLQKESERADLHEKRAEQALHKLRTEQGINEDLRAEIAKQLQVTTTLEQSGSENLEKAARKINHVEEDLLSAHREIKMLQESESILMKRVNALQNLRLNDVAAEETARQLKAWSDEILFLRRTKDQIEEERRILREQLYDKKEEIMELKKQECNKTNFETLQRKIKEKESIIATQAAEKVQCELTKMKR